MQVKHPSIVDLTPVEIPRLDSLGFGIQFVPCSVDLQDSIMLPEAAAICCHGTKRFFEVSVIVTMNCHCFGDVCQASSSSITSLRGTHGIFRLTTHGGMSVIRQRQQSPRSTARWWSHFQSLYSCLYEP